MAIIYKDQQPSAETIHVINETNAWYQLSESSAWAELKKLIDSLVDEAHEDMIGNLSNDPMAYMRLQLRWQQRNAMARAIYNTMDNMLESRKEAMISLTEGDQNE